MERVGTGGGSLALAELIDEHGAALYADFASEYGLNLSEVVLSRSPREVLALVEGLPDTSRLFAHVQGGEEWRKFIGWGTDRHMFADLFNLFVQVNTDAKKKPFQYPRPGTKTVQQGTPFMAMVPRRNPKG